jgi:hypothetical protein
MSPEVPIIVQAARRLTDQDLAALVSDLQAIQAARWATAHQTTFDHEAGAVA